MKSYIIKNEQFSTYYKGSEFDFTNDIEYAVLFDSYEECLDELNIIINEYTGYSYFTILEVFV